MIEGILNSGEDIVLVKTGMKNERIKLLPTLIVSVKNYALT